MLYASDFRRIARNSLRGRWPLAVGTGFVAGLLGADIANLEYHRNHITNENIATTLENGSSPFSAFAENGKLVISNRSIGEFLNSITSSDIGTLLQPFLITIMIMILLYLLITIVIGGASTLGYAKFNLALVDRKDARFEDLFSQFDRIGAGFCMQFLRGLYVFLWSLLLIIPGIIAAYSYAMTPYIMVEHPGYGANEAIGLSKELMRGNKWRLFCLELSFIGWGLLSTLTLGIGFLWLIPYTEAANAAFYRDVSGENLAYESIPAVDA
mgnify:CR=1 FL=1